MTMKKDRKKLKRTMLCFVMLLMLGAMAQPVQAQSTWTEKVVAEPVGFNASEVDTPDELAWVITLINGRSTEPVVEAQPSLDVTLTADIDMSGPMWVPLGKADKPYTGHFDGGGHLVSGMSFNLGGTEPAGMFGTVAESAIIENLFVNSAGQGVAISNWHLPSVGQWRRLESALPFLGTAEALNAGYKAPAPNQCYWTSSMGVSASGIFIIAFNGTLNKEVKNTYYVRGIRDFEASGKHLGDVVSFVDGSQGVVFHVNRDDTGGWAVALEDASPNSCSWVKTGTSGNIGGLSPLYANESSFYTTFLEDCDGSGNTLLMRNAQGNGGSYSVGVLDPQQPQMACIALHASYLGGLVGELKGNAIMRYCQAATKVVTADETSFIGGLVGHMADNAVMHSCMAFTSMEGHSMAGLAGKTESTATVSNCFSDACYNFLNSDAPNHVDGFVADNAGQLDNCYTLMQNEGAINGTGWHLPSVGETCKFWAAYSVMDDGVFAAAGGTDPGIRPNSWSAPYFWTSTVYSSDKVVAINNNALSAVSPTTTSKVRGVRNYTSDTPKKIGDVMEFTDMVNGVEVHTKGIVFYLNPEDDGLTGWAIKTVNENNGRDLAWGDNASGPNPINPAQMWQLLYDTDGNANMEAMLKAQGTHALAATSLASFDELEFTPAASTNYNACYSPENFGYEDNRNTGEFTETESPYLYNHKDNHITMQGESQQGKSLLDALNDWVNRNPGEYGPHAHWMRTSGSVINGDYPVLRLDGSVSSSIGYFTAVAIRNGVELQYGSLKDLLSCIKEKDIFFYGKEDVEYTPKNKNVKLYLDGESSLLGNAAYDDVYAGVTFPKKRLWHMFSTPLKDVPLGLDYTAGTSVHEYNVAPFPYPFYDESIADGYFPSKTYGTGEDYYGKWDYFCFFEPQYHWINFKRDNGNHWHEDGEHEHIDYYAHVGTTLDQNERELVVGKGYLLALESEEGTLMQAHGTLNGGTAATEVDFGVTRQGEYCAGYNLMGNPYPSYLDFDKFVENANNAEVLGGEGYLEYMTLNPSARGYVYYVKGSSINDHESVAPRYIHPHQGFFVNVGKDGTMKFDETMRTNAGTEKYRDDNDTIAYPLVNLFATDSNGKQEIAVIELGRPEAGGAIKMREMRFANCVMYARYEDENYAIAFTKEGETSVPVRFEVINDDSFTLTWETRNGTFEYLHLIDNLTGADIDMLTCNNYKFNGKTTDYSSRFKLVFEYTGVEENEEEIAQDNFAFMMNDNLVVTGEGYLELIDLNGRTLYETRLTDAQTMVGLPDVAKGLYLLRLTNNKKVNTQKIVIK